MAAVPVSKAFVGRLTQATAESKLKGFHTQIKGDNDVNEQHRYYLQSVCFLRKIFVSCHDQAITIYIEKDSQS